MTAPNIKKGERSETANKAKPEPPWNVILHNDWDNSMPRVVVSRTLVGLTCVLVLVGVQLLANL